MTWSMGTTTQIYPNFYLSDTLDSRLSQINWQALKKMSLDGNAATIVTMKNLAICYSTDTYAVDKQNDKIYAVLPTG